MADTDVTKYDAIILGSGQGGKPLAVELAGAGWNVALIEARHLGGTCVNEGCTPTKTMVASARVAHLVHRAEDYGVKTGAVTVDLAVVRDRKRSIVETFRGGSEKLVEKTDNL
ncbi:FAD-containing oxidoreductase, partial [candidate division GN15 bacterium]|nr:FAD-containing oxidoreductase [candidate division GN15 bacterium]